MKWRRVGVGLLLGLLTSVPALGVIYIGDQLAGLTFAPFTIFEFMTRVLPGAVVTLTIDLMVTVITGLNLGPTAETAKLAEQAMALVQFIIAGGLLGVVLAWVGNRGSWRRLPLWGLAGGLVLLLVAMTAEIAMGSDNLVLAIIWLAAVLGGWGLALGWVLREALFIQAETPDAEGRRTLLYLGGAALLALVTSAIGLAAALRERMPVAQEEATPTPIGPSSADTSGPAASPPEPTLEARIQPVAGTRREITSNEEFYRIDINLRPPSVDGDEWRLSVAGLVDNPRDFTLNEIRALPAQSQYITLSCISNQIGGDLISTSRWTGVRLVDFLDEVGLQPEATALYIESADGFYETVVMEDMMDPRTLLVYEMNGEPLPVEHGYPLRIYIPNRFGMKQPKWIVRMEAVAEEREGYWVERGWSRTAFVRTTSVVDVVADQQTGDQLTTIGGIAYAGARGISRVEVQVDDGPWQEAQLRVPPLSPLTWVQWRYEWPAQPGRHTARVRAYDGTGELQVLEDSPPHPDGATGVDSFDFRT
ncbi:MAG: molybdopterin-dependent oxidoreductase [Anaerolineae bacterium]|nr:molybdopterin-dependent oxidoreductase [Anaerolineae bacterium]